MRFNTYKGLIRITILLCITGVGLYAVQNTWAKSPKKKQLNYTFISSRDLSPVHSFLQKSLQALLPEAEETYLDYKSKRAKKLIRKLKIKFIPFIIFDDSIASEDIFFHMVKNNMVEKRKGRYVIPEDMLRAAEIIWLGRKRIPNQLDIFVMTRCFACKEAEVKLINFIRKNKLELDLKIRYKVKFDEFGVSSRFGVKDIRESLRQIGIQKYYPDKFWDYLLLLRNQTAEQAVKKLGISLKEIDAKKEEAMIVLRQDAEQAQLFKIRHTPTFLWENKYLLPSLKSLKRHKPFDQLPN